MTTDSFDCVFTSYNSASTILLALESAASQSITPGRIIIVDDCSTDMTWDLILSCKDKIPNLVALKNDENRGQSYSRNLAVQNSTADYIVFFDDDDISYPERAEEHLQSLRGGTDVSYVSSQMIYNNNYIKKAINLRVDKVVFDLPEILEQFFYPDAQKNLGAIYFPSSTLAIRKITFIKVFGFDTNLRRLEDIDLAIRLAMENSVFSFSDKLLVDRHASIGPDKASSIDSKFELILIEKYRKFMKQDDYKLSVFYARARGYYFSKDIFRLLMYMFKNLFLFLHSTYRLRNVKNRLVHDFKKRRR